MSLVTSQLLGIIFFPLLFITIIWIKCIYLFLPGRSWCICQCKRTKESVSGCSQDTVERESLESNDIRQLERQRRVPKSRAWCWPAKTVKRCFCYYVWSSMLPVCCMWKTTFFVCVYVVCSVCLVSTLVRRSSDSKCPTAGLSNIGDGGHPCHVQ